MIDTVLNLWPMPSAFVGLFLAGLAITIIYVDITRFEIDILAVYAAAVCIISLGVHFDFNILSQLFAGLIMLSIAALIHRISHKGFGLGDYYLYALMGLSSGVGLLVLLVALNFSLGLIVAASYSVARKKPLFKSAFPAAIPGISAATFCLTIQVFSPNVASQLSSGQGAYDMLIPQVIISLHVQVFIACLAILLSAFVLMRNVIGAERIAW